jgi:hypothetical protein
MIAVVPHPTPLRGATLPARGRDGIIASVRSSRRLSVRSTIFVFKSLPFTGRVAREAGRVG